MGLSREDVDRVAALSRLELDEATRQEMADQLGRVLAYMAKLDELDTSAVEPMLRPNAGVNVFRPDVGAPSLDPEEALLNAPDRVKTFFRAPRVIELG